jgi:hypothetical protein
VVWLVNQFVPPDLAPTARLLGDLSEGLRKRGWDVYLLGRKTGYRAKSVSGLQRWLRDFGAHVKLFFRGLVAPRPDIILCLTDPPALVFTMKCLSFLRGAKLVHWPMDVYPQIAVALGALKSSSVLYKLIHAASSWAIRESAAVVSLDDDMRRALALPDASAIIPPWVSPGIVIPEHPPFPDEAKLTWLYSGNLGRAHDFETLLRAQQILEKAEAPFELVFQGGGACQPAAQALAKELGLRSCRWQGYADDGKLVASLLAAQVVIATQREETRGLLWPSKLAVLQALPRPIVWIGAPGGAIAQSLHTRPGLTGLFAPGDAAPLAQWLLSHAEDFRAAGRRPVSPQVIRDELTTAREKSIEAWHQLLGQMRSSRACA